MELTVIEEVVKAETIEVGDIVKVDTTTGVEYYLAVEHPKVDNGRLALISFEGESTRGTIRRADMSLVDFLQSANYIRGYRVFKEGEYELKLSKKGAK